MSHIIIILSLFARTHRPSPLTFSIEVQDNSQNEVVSSERELQTKRLAHVLEVRLVCILYIGLYQSCCCCYYSKCLLVYMNL